MPGVAKLYFVPIFRYMHNLRSITLTLKVQSALLPDPSVKVYVTCVVPTLKKSPGARVLDVKLTMPELSVAVGSVQVTVAPATPVPTVCVTSLMQFITGATLSTVKMCNKQIVILITYTES